MDQITAGRFRPLLMAGCFVVVGMASGAPATIGMAPEIPAAVTLAAEASATAAMTSGVPTAVDLPVVVEVAVI